MLGIAFAKVKSRVQALLRSDLSNREASLLTVHVNHREMGQQSRVPFPTSSARRNRKSSTLVVAVWG